jgi:2,4-dienoyl-CoA reductase-like NADH-dependent reductase (Old Yellow Enzyme family)
VGIEKKFPHLFSPLKIRGYVFRNRIASSPHQFPTLFEPAGNSYVNHYQEAALYYGAIARSGAATVSTGHLGVDPRFALGMNEEDYNFFSRNVHTQILPILHAITDAIHAYGAVAQIELNHGGEKCKPYEGNKVFGPCSFTMIDGREVVAMDEDEMERIAEYFAEAADIGRRGGFDSIYVHGAHNWLLGQFFSPLSNHRTDKYGGNVENRARYPLLVLKKIRQRVGNDTLIQMRFSASELVAGGNNVEESAEIINILSEVIDSVQCSAGKIHNMQTTGYVFPMQYMKHGVNTYLAGEIRKRVHIPVETVGGINDPAMADELIALGIADMVSMARTFVADIDWAEKARSGKTEDIRPCIRCMRCMNFSASHSGHSVCTVNPHKNFRFTVLRRKSDISKKVVVIGGGPAGMEAATDIADDGHDVILIEKNRFLGGRLAFADHIVFKEDVRRYRDYLIAQAYKRKNINIMLGVEATSEMIEKIVPDVIVLAIGAEAIIPPIPGIDGKNVRLVSDIFGCERELGDRVVIIGGGTVGCETTVHLQSLGKMVDVVELRDELIHDGTLRPEETFYTKFFI